MRLRRMWHFDSELIIMLVTFGTQGPARIKLNSVQMFCGVRRLLKRYWRQLSAARIGLTTSHQIRSDSAAGGEYLNRLPLKLRWKSRSCPIGHRMQSSLS